jgi:hypothetical protein
VDGGEIGTVQSRIDLHWYSDYTSGKKITVYPLNIVYSRRFTASYCARSRDCIANVAMKYFCGATQSCKIRSKREVPINRPLLECAARQRRACLASSRFNMRAPGRT